jgi:hypothetical protein
MKTAPDPEQTFLKIVRFASSLGFGVMLATATMLRSTRAGFSFEFSWLAPLAFALGFGATMAFWRRAAQGRTLRWPSAGMLLLGGCVFLAPLRFVPKENLFNVISGLFCAAMVLSFGGFMIFRLIRLINEGEQRNAEREAAERSVKPDAD